MWFIGSSQVSLAHGLMMVNTGQLRVTAWDDLSSELLADVCSDFVGIGERRPVTVLTDVFKHHHISLTHFCCENTRCH